MSHQRPQKDNEQSLILIHEKQYKWSSGLGKLPKSLICCIVLFMFRWIILEQHYVSIFSVMIRYLLVLIENHKKWVSNYTFPSSPWTFKYLLSILLGESQNPIMLK
jgi:hypothetical protein